MLGIQEADSSGTSGDAFFCFHLYIVRQPRIATMSHFFFGSLMLNWKNTAVNMVLFQIIKFIDFTIVGFDWIASMLFLALCSSLTFGDK